MHRRRVLLLDVMGTLVRDPFFEDVPRFFETTLDRLVAEKDPDAWPCFERDAIDEAELIRCFFRDGRIVDGAGLKQALVAGYRYLPGIEPLLARLRDAGVEMHALSNYPRWHALIERKLGVSRYVRWTFVSCKTGLRKPSPHAYRYALRALGIAAPDAIFVDDVVGNCQAAAAEGITAIRFTDAAQLRSELAKLGLFRGAPC